MSMLSLEWEEFRAAVRRWIATHPRELQEILEEALRNLPMAPGPTAEAQWASRWARVLWARANLDPPGPPW